MSCCDGGEHPSVNAKAKAEQSATHVARRPTEGEGVMGDEYRPPTSIAKDTDAAIRSLPEMK